ncbi:hypothetical protein GHT06_018036 [Daphnia sinensis]|uniref:Uncharacterized protein n=1 Tax=Daphnia sinensis TaxID=1820382 RepID=A0AAD5L3T9_9CRUS|nr:hypothetical protein GHT06_018036 [Daphnia sinensis]
MLSLRSSYTACQKRSTIILYCGCINTSGGGRGGAMEEKVIASIFGFFCPIYSSSLA